MARAQAATAEQPDDTLVDRGEQLRHLWPSRGWQREADELSRRVAVEDAVEHQIAELMGQAQHPLTGGNDGEHLVERPVGLRRSTGTGPEPPETIAS